MWEPIPVTHSFRKEVITLAYRLLGDRHDAEDVVQNALLIAHQRYGELRQSESYTQWVKQILKRASSLLQRNSMLQRRLQENWARVAVQESYPPGDVEVVHLKEFLRSLIEELPTRQREVIVL